MQATKTTFEKVRDNAAIIISLCAAIGTGVNAWVNYQARTETPKLEYHCFSGHSALKPISKNVLFCSVANTGSVTAKDVYAVCDSPGPSRSSRFSTTRQSA